MDHLAPPEPDAPERLTPDEAQRLVLTTVANEAESLLRTARRHSLCADDAHDAYQRGMEIFMRRAATLDPARASHWLHVVVKHEAQALRKSRSALVAFDDVDFDRHEARHVAPPEERVLAGERLTRAAEALRRLKPDELRAVWLKALGKSYQEIADETRWSATKVNRALTEGRRSFLERFAGIESGAECVRWEPLLSALVDGEATPAQLADLRPHLRNCGACRATVRALHDADRPLAALLPAGLVGLGAKLGALVDRLLPAGGAAEPAAAVVTAGGAGVVGAGGLKLAAVLATGAMALGGGGAAVVGHQHHDRATAGAARTAPARAAVATTTSTPVTLVGRPRAAQALPPTTARTTVRRPVVPTTTHSELKPSGDEVTAAAAPRATSATAHPPAAPVDASAGEFAPQP